MAGVRAKFFVGSVKQSLDRNGAVTSTEVELWPTFGYGSEENKKFWEATPSGHLTMMITNPDAYGQFVSGQTYYLDFVQADIPEPAAVAG